MDEVEVRNKLSQFLNGLARDDKIDLLFTDTEGKRLALCLCIDIISARADAAVVANIINALDSRLGSVNRQFAHAFEAMAGFNDLRCVSGSESPSNERYTRVVSLSSFINFYMRQYALNSQDPNDIESVRRRYFSDSLDGHPLGDVTACWSGQFGLVWVLPDAIFVDVFTHHRDGLANALNDALGLGISSSSNPAPQLGAVRYPANFPVTAVQPTIFDADWSCSHGFYLSIKFSDHWGKTCSCTGTRSGHKERVHRKFEHGLSDDFRGVYLGTVDDLVPDANSVLEEGYRRFKDS
jgi:hypothetical protein